MVKFRSVSLTNLHFDFGNLEVPGYSGGFKDWPRYGTGLHMQL